MDVAHILLGRRPWLYDYNVINHGCENTYTFKHGGKTILLRPAKPDNEGKSLKSRNELLTTSEMLEEVQQLLQQFRDITPDELPSELPPMREIKHAIDFIPGSQLSNLPHYKMNPKDRVELNRQVSGLLEKGLYLT
ncbi:uncharacterized protein LOC129290041 [Prosopis cineraria]|uniref:uncharacterized protein LOC129290041 n=1 Tax=Prosopis cineraria TaxID=364024 RepID=UPI00240EE0D6|nr:uncharacterized protein LOC129290041 [Prosopis cineraria]